MVPIIYVLSVIFLFIVFLLLKKSDNKISITKSIIINVVFLLCYNAFMCFILDTLNLHIKLEYLSVINIIIGAIFLAVIIQNKEIQKFYFNSNDIVAILFILTISIIAMYANFGLELNIKYIMTDASVHFSAARELYEYDVLVNRLDNEVITGPFLIGAYTNTGILFKIFEPVIGEVNLYKVFILFDIFIFFLLGLCIYCAIEKLVNSTWKLILSMIAIIFFMFGYPFNSLIFGFVYLQLGVLIIATIINVFGFYNENFDKKILFGILSILNLGVFFTYCIFVPVVFLVEIIYLIKKSYDINKKIFSIKNLIICFILFVIPFLCWIYYNALPYLTNAQAEGSDMFLNIEGYIYRNCWSNFILILPIAIMCIKNKNDDIFIWKTFLIVLIIFMILFFILIKSLNFSFYYYYKFNFILWFILWYGAIYSLNTSEKKINIFLQVYLILYIIIAMFATSINKVEITKEEFDNNENITNSFDIYGINKSIINDVIIDYTPEQLKLVEYVYYNIDLKSDNILLIANPRQECWFNAFFNYSNRDDIESLITYTEIEKWNNRYYKYILIFYNNEFYERFKDYINYENLLIENETGAIYINN